MIADRVTSNPEVIPVGWKNALSVQAASTCPDSNCLTLRIVLELP